MNEQQEREKASRENASKLEREIGNLKSYHQGLFSRKYKEFWDHAKNINELFKTLKPLSKDDRERLWAKFDNVCKTTKEAQTREQEGRKNNSRWKRDLIESKITAAERMVKYAKSMDELNEARSIFIEAKEMMPDSWDGLGPVGGFTPFAAQGPLILIRQDREAVWEQWKAANDFLYERRKEFQRERDRVREENYTYFRSKASNAYSRVGYDDKEAKSLVRGIQQELKGASMRQEHFKEIISTLDEIWEQASKNQHTAFKERERLREERRIKNAQWRATMEGHIDRWNDVLRKNEDYLSDLRRQIDKLEDMESGARSSDFADRVRGWISEKHDKINDVQRRNQELEDKISSARHRLDDDARRN